MQLSNKLYHINAGLSNQFIFMFSIIRDFDQFILLLELYKLRIQDEPTIQIVVEHCTKYPNRKSILNKVDNQLQDSLKLDYYQVETFLPDLQNKLEYINNNYKDNIKLFNFPINNQFKVIFNKIQLNRLFNDIESFYKNYLILETLFQLTLSEQNNTKKEIISIEEQRDKLKNEHTQKYLNNQNKDLPISNESINKTEETRIDNIFESCINSVLKSFLLHITINYYFYINKNHCVVENKEELTFKLPTLFPLSYIFNIDYFKSLILSLNKYTLDNIKLRCDKILRKLQDDEIETLEIMMLTCLFFIYCIRFLNETHTDYLSNNIKKLFNDSDLQLRLLNNHVKTYFPNFKISFNIYDITIEDIEEKDLDNNIEEISQNYKHLISVSEEDFIDNVFKDLNKNKNKDLILNSKKIFNIESLKTQKSAAVKNNILQNPEFNNLQGDLFEYDLINYNFNSQYLTDANLLLNQYIEDKNTFLIRLRNNEIKENVPITIINLFELITNILYSEDINIQQYYNTYDYYNILCNQLKDPTVFPHIIFLYIIYQIIIPYLYLNYNIKEFEDVF